MKRFIAGCLLSGLIVSLSGMGRADEAAAPQDLNHYLAGLQVKLAHSAQRANQPSTDGSSVVGLRGSQQTSASKQLYWKGVGGDGAVVSPPEVKLFRTAVQEAQDGKKSAAIAALEDFQKTYPKSALLPDVEETLHRLNAVDAPAATPTPTVTHS